MTEDRSVSCGDQFSSISISIIILYFKDDWFLNSAGSFGAKRVVKLRGQYQILIFVKLYEYFVLLCKLQNVINNATNMNI